MFSDFIVRAWSIVKIASSSLTFITFGEGGRFSSSEKEGERGFRRRRVGLGVAGGEGDGVVG